MTPVTLITIDDEPLALRRLDILLRGCHGVRHLGSASGCAEGLALILRTRPDVVLLDIRMRDGSGFDLVDQLPHGIRPNIIFVTAFDHFAIRAFESAAVDYLLKPIDRQRLSMAIDRARDRVAANDSADQINELRLVVDNLRERIHEREQSPYERELWIRGAAGGLTRVSLDDVQWVSTEDDYVRLHSKAGSHLLRMSIRALESRVDPQQFVRVHRAALVRVDQIVEIRRSGIGRRELVLRSGDTISVGRVYAQQLKAFASAASNRMHRPGTGNQQDAGRD